MKFVRDKLYDTLIIDYKGKIGVKLKKMPERQIQPIIGLELSIEE
jgi:hypothetical protein